MSARRPFLHPAAPRLAQEVARGELSRREFLTRATALGVSTGTAYGLLGATPATAQDIGESPDPEGGTLRIEQNVMALKDPRTFDFPQLANFTRGWLEYLVRYERDGSFTPMLLEGWKANEDATRYELHVRPEVTWNDGSAFTAADVVRNISRWCETEVEGNSMAPRLAALVDPQTGLLRDGAVETPDDHTVVLTLSRPDITLVATFSDYPAAVVPEGFDPDAMIDNPVGTGPYIPRDYVVGERAVLVRNEEHEWWGTGAAVGRFEFLDFGTDPASHLDAARADEVDVLYETTGGFIGLVDELGWQLSEAMTAATIVIRANQRAEIDGARPYADKSVRSALQLACDNSVLLELGYGDLGTLAANHHVAPVQAAYADIGPATYDPEEALRLMQEAGMADFEHELISIDDDWRRNTADAAAALLNDAGLKVSRTVLPGEIYWQHWRDYPFSATDWGHRPLAVQTLALAYRSGSAWNETGYASEEFDAALATASSIADAAERREVMAELEHMLRDDGVVIQPYWRTVYRHVRPGVRGADAHPAFEIHVTEISFES